MRGHLITVGKETYTVTCSWSIASKFPGSTQPGIHLEMEIRDSSGRDIKHNELKADTYLSEKIGSLVRNIINGQYTCYYDYNREKSDWELLEWYKSTSPKPKRKMRRTNES